nr:immunoglobulin heavy chain junction region [Macaca mulatta]
CARWSRGYFLDFW